jgi:hypothetical protein
MTDLWNCIKSFGKPARAYLAGFSKTARVKLADLFNNAKQYNLFSN